MITIEKVEVVGWEPTIRGMRNPKNSWDRSDSYCSDDGYIIGPKDHKLMMDLVKGGPVHAKFRRMIVVYADITAPMYWWKEYDTYKVGTVANSCSTMHKLPDKEFTLDDFSYEHLIDPQDPEFFGGTSLHVLCITMDALNYWRKKYLETKIKPMKDESKRAGLMKKYWWQMIQLLPSSYNQKRTVMLNYEVLNNIHIWRKNHKLDEWVQFCDWIESLPYSEIITGCELNHAIPVPNDYIAVEAPVEG